MNRNWMAVFVLILAAGALLGLSSCGRNQHLVSITVTPQGTTITQGPGQQVATQFTALGSYIHPPETRDITSTAIWSTNTPDIIEVDSTTPGLIKTTGAGCGTNLGVTAKVYTDHGNTNGNVVIGTATISVSFGPGNTCP